MAGSDQLARLDVQVQAAGEGFAGRVDDDLIEQQFRSAQEALQFPAFGASEFDARAGGGNPLEVRLDSGSRAGTGVQGVEEFLQGQVAVPLDGKGSGGRGGGRRFFAHLNSSSG
ncbi:hypothetical protein GCM10008957_32290 [Deinococcus ruber]|uniref:Uncharacterized protein n=1 Tax=Deinococcus ruber TaxID=1848197 RepID=A0A918CDA4_9DEIO|nr:hypothetical protein GCM10008957_32290 [Deinococcus ruber]